MTRRLVTVEQYQVLLTKNDTQGELLTRALDRVRHDHDYPMDSGPHRRCVGCVLEDDIRTALQLREADSDGE